MAVKTSGRQDVRQEDPGEIKKFKMAPSNNLRKKMPRDPRKPKRPMNSFMHFYKAKRSEIEKHPRLRFHSQPAKARVAKEMWRKASRKDKKRAMKSYLKSKKAYTKAMKKYTPPTREQWDYIMENWPKRFRVNYNFYVMDKFAKVKKANPGSGFGAISRKVARKWKKLSQAGRKPYNKRFRKDMKRYLKAVDALWASI